jgi:hypothetical protein
VIAIEEPFFKMVLTEAEHSRCASCLKCNQMNLIPSENTQTGKKKKKSRDKIRELLMFLMGDGVLLTWILCFA